MGRGAREVRLAVNEAPHPPAPPRRRRRGRWIAVGVLLLVAGAIAAAIVWFDAIGRDLIERAGTEVLGVPTRLRKLHVGFLRGHVRLADLAIDNPPGFRDPQFLALGACDLQVDRATLLSDEIVAPLLTLDGLTLSLERNRQGANYDIVLANLAAEEKSEGAAEEPGPRFVIREVPLPQGLDEVGRETLAYLLRSAVRVLADEHARALTRAEAEVEFGVPQKREPAPPAPATITEPAASARFLVSTSTCE